MKSAKNYTNQEQAATNYGDHIDSVVFDKDGYMYINSHHNGLVRRFPPDSTNGTAFVGTGSSVSGTLKRPHGLAIDYNSNLYISDIDAGIIYQAPRNGTALIPVIDTSSLLSRPQRLLSPLGSSNEIYINDDNRDAVYLWKFNTTTPSLILTNVIGGTTLKNPKGMKLDTHGNLYVADYDNQRIVMYCANSTVGIVVATMDDQPIDLAFDSEMNMYVLTENGLVSKYKVV